MNKIEERPIAEVAWSPEPVEIDGRLDEPVWSRAAAYPLATPADRPGPAGATPHEGGTVRFAWDATHFYAAFDLVDRDVVQECDTDQAHHYRTGDVAELFLKPVHATHYWELYVTPNGRRTSFFFPSRGRLGLPSGFEYDCGLRVAAQVAGTLNDPRDEDRGWTAEMAVPLQDLAAAGIPLTPEHPWTVLAGRYNYGCQLPTIGPELSSFPAIRKPAFHLHEAYAQLMLREP